ncbi:bifunctional demethylmenaquinone methyltransferase/2-methoxy-6-polyprenyl-1,4-benzoquinol methylase UbiE [Helicobacter baculiformis]|uniref:Bifunctional demethylmenaquinone methyltransferase/2-methoxy-6-polyprenyl-1,4-benzoquinol methylase UbiE n=1 Tax=Helicobacter baculiformis TaxID=427351 RepID=A0ABV7ZKW5_9HELI|nr:bifunctional demethylmenaquinone methyltransferase/2-methoxy-6-polyprenyl-1,4-benzoquinol methylase UbiE [Helicobacter baculiformis]
MKSERDQEQKKIIGMFDAIASTYDTTNRVLSFKQDEKWRKDGIARALRWVYAFKGDLQHLRVADVACGTADMLLHILEALEHSHGDLEHIYGIDPSKEMLHLAQEKISARAKNYTSKISLECLQAKHLSVVQDQSLDLISIAYGLRNVLDRRAALSEFSRTLKKGGVLLVLEFMRCDQRGILGTLAHFYTSKILPIFGMLLSHNYKAYAYLPASIESFISADELEDELNSVGLEVVEKKYYLYKSVSCILAVKNTQGQTCT